MLVFYFQIHLNYIVCPMLVFVYKITIHVHAKMPIINPYRCLSSNQKMIL
uniref:Uncharacterized protein n=1 Tax=Arundo donax TaxID=35708 RepID=A0A0A9AX64_ARUDO